MRGYLNQLQRQAELANRAQSGRAQPAPYTPVREQLAQLINSLPPRQLNRAWSLREIQALLKGRYRAHPSLAMLADELRRLGWSRVRDWTNSGRGCRLWIPATGDIAVVRIPSGTHMP